MGLPPSEVEEAAAVGKWHIFEGRKKEKRWGILPVWRREVRVVDREGVIRLRREGLGAVVTTKARLAEDFALLLEETVEYGTVGGVIPALFAYCGEKQIDLSGLASGEQALAVLAVELDGSPKEEKIVVLAVR